VRGAGSTGGGQSAEQDFARGLAPKTISGIFGGWSSAKGEENAGAGTDWDFRELPRADSELRLGGAGQFGLAGANAGRATAGVPRGQRWKNPRLGLSGDRLRGRSWMLLPACHRRDCGPIPRHGWNLTERRKWQARPCVWGTVGGCRGGPWRHTLRGAPGESTMKNHGAPIRQNRFPASWRIFGHTLAIFCRAPSGWRPKGAPATGNIRGYVGQGRVRATCFHR